MSVKSGGAELPPLSDRSYRIVFGAMKLLFDGWIHTELHGAENLPPEGRPTIICFSHTSALDYAGGYALQRHGYYAIKREVLELPIVGRILRDVGGIPIKRDEKDTDALRTMRAVLRAGHILGIAPEGTRSRDGSLGPFDPGFVWLASRTDALIVPMAIHGAYDLLPAGRLIPRRGTIHVGLGPPRSLADEGRRIPRARMEEIAAELRRDVLDVLGRLSAISGLPDPAVEAERARLAKEASEAGGVGDDPEPSRPDARGA